jgi:hypothetical protein
MAGLVVNDSVTFSQAIQSHNIIPGDILQLTDGIYKGDWVITFSGSSGNPIKIMPRHPGKVVIDGSLLVSGSYIEIYDIDFTDSRPDRHVVTNGITMNRPGCGLFGCSICDLHFNGVNTFGSGVRDFKENIIYNNGYLEADNSGHGHAIYGRNNLGGLSTIARNLFFKQLGRYTIHIYSQSENYLKDFHCIDNIICGHPVHTGGGLGLSNFLYDGNIQYGRYCQLGRYSPPGSNMDATIVNNTFIELVRGVKGDDGKVYSYYVFDFQSRFEENNLVYHCESWPDYPGYTLLPVPPTLTRVIPFSKSKRWLGAVAIYNRDSAETVAVDFSSLLPNDSYRLRNGQNIIETWEFDYTGGAVNVPTDWTSAARIGDSPTVSTWPIFGGLVIEKVD